MSSMVNPASATAARHASTVSESGGRISRRPICELPIPVIATLSSNFSVGARGRTLTSGRAGDGTASDDPSGSGSNSGNQTSSCWWNVTRPGIPTYTSRGSQPTTLVVSRTSASAVSDTMASEYGGGMDGSHICSLHVQPTTTPVPLTAVQVRSQLWQCGQTVWEGCNSRPQESQRGSRSSPAPPPVQNGADQPPTTGSGRTASSCRPSVRTSLTE